MNPVQDYFSAEKVESVFFVAVGVLAIGVAAYLFFNLRTPFYKGVAYPLVAIALIQITVGTTIFWRSPKDMERVNSIMRAEPQRIQTEEIPRMEKVMANFALYRWVEIALLALGIVLVFWASPESVWRGVSIGLAVQSALMLILDYFAEQRGAEYLDFLNGLSFAQ